MFKEKKNNITDIYLILLKKISKPVLNNRYSQFKVKTFLSSLFDK